MLRRCSASPSGLLGAVLGIGGGFVLVPGDDLHARDADCGRAGTSLFQIIFVAANVTFLQAYTNHTVDAVLALLLLIGGVLGAQVGTRYARDCAVSS